MKKSLIKATIYTGVYGAILIVVRLISKQPLETLLFVSLFYFAIGFFYGNIFRDRKEFQRGFHNGMDQAMKSFIMPMAFSDILSSVVQHAHCDCENCDQKNCPAHPNNVIYADIIDINQSTNDHDGYIENDDNVE